MIHCSITYSVTLFLPCFRIDGHDLDTVPVRGSPRNVSPDSGWDGDDDDLDLTGLGKCNCKLVIG